MRSVPTSSQIAVADESWQAMQNKTTLLTVSLGNCALATARNVDSQMFEYTNEHRGCTMAMHQDRGIEEWHPRGLESHG